MSYKTLEYERRGLIGMLTLNRPERLNAINTEMQDELLDFWGNLARDFETRVVIIQGKGRAFCAGADLSGSTRETAGERERGGVPYAWHFGQKRFTNIYKIMYRVPQPLIAAVRGAAAGGGFSLVLACDMCIAGESARFNVAYIKAGFSGADMGTSYFLPRIIGHHRAAEYMYTGRFMDATTAERFGIVSRVVPDDQVEASALELAEEILQNSPFGVRMTKETLNLNIDASSLESAIELEMRSNLLCIQTEDCKEAGRAFFEKRPSTFHNR